MAVKLNAAEHENEILTKYGNFQDHQNLSQLMFINANRVACPKEAHIFLNFPSEITHA